MEWRDEGIILSLRKYGEFDAILDVLTRDHGRHAGIVKGGLGRRHRGNIQPGNEVNVTWRGRLESHLGTYSIELKRSRSVAFIYDAPKLAALNSCCSLLCIGVAENEPHEYLLDGLNAFFDALELSENNIVDWGPLLVKWELGLLSELGFGLNLDKCAATGGVENLIYVSPKSGRAVSKDAGEPYHDKMLLLPLFLTANNNPVTINDVKDGLLLTEYFINRYMLSPYNKKIPQARRMIMDYVI